MEGCLGLIRHSGNDALFTAVEMSLLSTYAGQPVHLHAEGLRGTGKTTVLRAVRQILPRIVRIKGCIYNCDPLRPHCPHHRHLSVSDVRAIGDERVPMPFLEISHSAKVGTAVGSIDLSRLVDPSRPQAALLPGTLVQAHRGIVLVDEINRLAETAPELADVLLDVMGTKPGRVQIEETGMPAVEMPVCVSVWAASNPDEDPGPLEEIRRQLSDRFDFVIPTVRPRELQVVRRVLDGMLDGGGGGVDQAKADVWRTKLASAAMRFKQVALPPALREHVAELYTRFDLESLRAVQAMLLGVRALAALDQRKEAELADLARVVPLALQHRVEGEVLAGALGYLQSRDARSGVKSSLAGLMAGAGRQAAPAAAASAPAPAAGAVPGNPQWSGGTVQMGRAEPLGGGAVAPSLRPVEKPFSSGMAPGLDPVSEAARSALSAPPYGRGATAPALAKDERPHWWQRLLGTYTPPPTGRRPGTGQAGTAEGSKTATRPGAAGAGQPGAAAGAPGAGAARAEAATPPGTPPRPGQAFRQAGGATGTAGAGAGAPMQMADPARTAVQAPPHPARSILELAEPELVRTQTDLKG